MKPTCRSCSFCQPCTSATTCRLAAPDAERPEEAVVVVRYSARRTDKKPPPTIGGPKADQLIGARKSRRSVCNLLNSLFLILALACLPSLTTAQEHIRFTSEEVALLQSTFRQRLGLTPPPPTPNAPPPKVPFYMWDLYRDTLADEVRHYYPARITTDHRGILLRYNLTVSRSQPSQERVVYAQLKLKLNAVRAKGARIAVKAIHEKIREIRWTVDAVNLEPSNSTQWIDLDVREVFARDRNDSQILEIFIEADPLSVVSDPTHSAALLVFIESDAPGAAANRKKRSARHQYRHNRQHRKHIDRKLCAREELTVSFKELNWESWIIAPASYQAFQCRGECPFPLPSQLNGTNHAIIQSLAHSIDPKFVPAPCCVPVELEDFKLLYRDINENVMLKTYPEMIVKSCGCK
uniref:TGF_BETA_2 domain-containing protein n=1 Tax=Steinernema glaseri TaxID=37863 RepID=A0A1I7Z4Z1_9BILA